MLTLAVTNLDLLINTIFRKIFIDAESVVSKMQSYRRMRIRISTLINLVVGELIYFSAS